MTTYTFTRVAPAPPGPATSILMIENHGGTIYGVSSQAGNVGTLYSWNGSAWVLVFASNIGVAVLYGVVSAGGVLYLIFNNATFSVYAWDGVTSWIDLNFQTAFPGMTPFTGCEHGGNLIVGFANGQAGASSASIVEWNGSAWSTLAGPYSIVFPAPGPFWGQLRSFAGALYQVDFNGVLYLVAAGVRTAVSGQAQRGAGTHEQRPNTLFVHAGELYYGLPSDGTPMQGGGATPGTFYKWNGVNAWIVLIPPIASSGVYLYLAGVLGIDFWFVLGTNSDALAKFVSPYAYPGNYSTGNFTHVGAHFRNGAIPGPGGLFFLAQATGELYLLAIVPPPSTGTLLMPMIVGGL